MKQFMVKHKILLLLPTVLLLVLLSGCIRVDVNLGIDDDFTAWLSYQITLDIDQSDLQYQNELKHALKQIGWHYQEALGFTVGLDIDDPPYVLTMTRQVPNSSFSQAFSSLEEMLTNEDITIFMKVDMASQGFTRQDRYMLSALTDIPQIMRLSNAEDLTPYIKERLEEGLAAGTGDITITLPASELISSSHTASMKNNHVTMSVPLEFTGQTGFELAAKINYLDDGTSAGTLEEILRENDESGTRGIYMIGAALVMIIIALLLIVRNILRRQKHDSAPKA